MLKKWQVFWLLGEIDKQSLLAGAPARGTLQFFADLKELDRTKQLTEGGLAVSEPSIREYIRSLENLLVECPPPHALNVATGVAIWDHQQRGKVTRNIWTPRALTLHRVVGRWLKRCNRLPLKEPSPA